jgi:hypothetical protein
VDDTEERKDIMEYMLSDLSKKTKAKESNRTTTISEKSKTILKCVYDGRCN